MKGKLLSAIIYGWIIVFSIITAMSLILVTVLRLTNLDESQLSWITLVVGLFALFTGGIFAGLKGKTKGWIIGICLGSGFTIIVFLLQYLGYQQAFTLEQTLYHLAYLAAATIGGVLGVNFIKVE